MQDDRIDYVGRAGEYRPSIGSSGPGADVETRVSFTYSDLDFLQNQLTLILDETTGLIRVAEDLMASRAIAVNVEDEALYEANNLEWPGTLGDPRNRISYRYYKALRVRDTTSAYYIRKRYEEAARDVAGNNAIDIISLAGIIKDEALLVREFLSVYVGNVDDAAEYRALEIFQDWTIAALEYTRKFSSIFQKGDSQTSVDGSGLGVGSAEEARQSQAVFKIKLNAANATILKDLDFVYKNYSEYASIFYGKYLGPALQFRLGVGRKTFPLGSPIAQEVDQSAINVDSKLESLLADQVLRNNMFVEKMNSLVTSVIDRDGFRNVIHQLAPVGKAIPQSGATVLVQTQDTDEEIAHFGAASTVTSRPSFGSPHGSLGDLDVDDHPQYFKKTGGELSGDLTLANGVLVDGMSPSLHHHTGQDGTEQIHAGDLLPGSLRTGAIDTSEIPTRPTTLRVVNQDIEIVPPGVAQLNAVISWLGTNPDDLYEVEYVPVGAGGEIKIIDPNAPFIPPTYEMATLDPDDLNPMFPMEMLYGPDQMQGSNFFTPSEGISGQGRVVRRVSDTRFITFFQTYEDAGGYNYQSRTYLDMFDITYTPTVDPGPDDLPYDVLVTRVGSPVEVGWSYSMGVDIQMIDSTTGVIAHNSLNGAQTGYDIILRKINISGNTLTLGAVHVVQADRLVPWFTLSAGSNILDSMISVFAISSTQVLLSYVAYDNSSNTYSCIRLFSVSGNTFTETASRVLTSGSGGYSATHPYIWLNSAQLVGTEIMVSGVDRTTYTTNPDPVYGDTGYTEDLSADFIAFVSVSGANLSLVNVTYPVTPSEPLVGQYYYDPGYMTGNAIPSDQNTVGLGYLPTTRRRVTSSVLLPAGTGKFIAARSFVFQYINSIYNGFELRPVSVSGTTATFGDPVIYYFTGLHKFSTINILPASNADEYWLFFSPPVSSGHYALWVDFNKTTNVLSNHDALGMESYGNGYGSAVSLTPEGFVLVCSLGTVSNRLLGGIYDPEMPIYSWVNEDKGTRQNVAVKEGVSIMSWAMGDAEQLIYRPVVVDDNYNVTFKTAVRFPDPEPTDKYYNSGYAFGHIAKLEEGKFVTATEEWVAIGNLNSSNDLSFSSTIPTPEVGKLDPNSTSWNGSPQRVTLFALSATKFVLLYSATSSAYGIDNQIDAEDMTMFGYVGTVNGTAITWGPRQDLTNAIGWESYGYWDPIPTSFQIQGAVMSGNTILLALHLADYSDPEVPYGVNSFAKLVIADNTITFSVVGSIPDAAQAFNPSEDPNTGIDLYMGYEMKRVEDNKALFVFTEQYTHGEGWPRLFAQIITMEGDGIQVHERYAFTDEGDTDEYNYHWNAQTTILGYGKWGVIRATPSGYGGEFSDRDPRIMAFKIDGTTITKVLTGQFSDREQYPGAISAPREDAAFIWIMDWSSEFGSTDRALAKIIYLT